MTAMSIEINNRNLVFPLAGLTVAILLFLVFPMFRDSSEVTGQRYHDLHSAASTLTRCPQVISALQIALSDGKIRNGEARVIDVVIDGCQREQALDALGSMTRFHPVTDPHD